MTTTSANKQIADKFKDILGPTDRKLDAEVRESLVTARVGLLLRASFFGNLATRLRLVNADAWCPTAATDGRNFYYNSRFIKMLRPKEIEFLFGHEILHCVYDHFGRRGNRDPQLFNIANDYCVNADLKKHGVGEFITTVPCLYDRRYEGMSSEEIYDILFENAEKINVDALIKQLLDEHLDGDDDDSGNKGKDSDGTGRPQLSEAEKQEIRDEIKEAVLSAAQASGAGNLPAGVLRIIEELTEPKMNWRELMRMQLESTIKSDYTWMRANRKGWHMDAVLPGMKLEPMIDIAVGLDMSGSVTDEMGKDFLGEIQGIMDSFPAYRIHVFSFDTEVHNPMQFDSDNLTSITEYQPMGGGGTDFVSIFDYLKREEIEPKRLVVFTDGEPYGSWGDPNYCDTVWIIHSNPGTKPPFGTWAEYKEEDK